MRLAKPHGVTVGRLKNHVFKQSLFEDDSSESDEKSPVDVHGNREKNQKAFLSYVKDAKAKKEISQMKAYINKLQSHLQSLNPSDITQKPRIEPQESGMKRAEINAAAMNKQSFPSIKSLVNQPNQQIKVIQANFVNDVSFNQDNSTLQNVTTNQPTMNTQLTD